MPYLGIIYTDAQTLAPKWSGDEGGEEVMAIGGTTET